MRREGDLADSGDIRGFTWSGGLGRDGGGRGLCVPTAGRQDRETDGKEERRRDGRDEAPAPSPG